MSIPAFLLGCRTFGQGSGESLPMRSDAEQRAAGVRLTPTVYPVSAPGGTA